MYSGCQIRFHPEGLGAKWVQISRLTIVGPTKTILSLRSEWQTNVILRQVYLPKNLFLTDLFCVNAGVSIIYDAIICAMVRPNFLHYHDLPGVRSLAAVMWGWGHVQWLPCLHSDSSCDRLWSRHGSDIPENRVFMCRVGCEIGFIRVLNVNTAQMLFC